jgi:hypothetical protein
VERPKEKGRGRGRERELGRFFMVNKIKNRKIA